jgi:hypothetical protein
MKVNDETLSAFLDYELPDTEMEQVRLALETDDELVMRLAELSEVDALLKQHANLIDQQPLSEALAKIVAKLQSNNVVQLSAWQRVKQSANKSLAIAASIAIVFGVGTARYMQTQSNPSLVAQNIATALDTQLSTDAITQANGATFKANLSFANLQGEFCRQYEVAVPANTNVAIACKTADGWQVKAQLQQGKSGNGSQYQTASSNAPLEQVIDQMISGAPLNAKQEQQAIAQQWKIKNNE